MAQNNLINKKACLFSALSLFATMYSYSDLKEASFLNNSLSVYANIAFDITFFILYVLYFKFFISKIGSFSTHSKVIGIFAGIINVLGRNFLLYNGMQFFDKDVIFAIVFSLLATIGYGLIYASVFELGWWYLKAQRGKGIGSKNNSSFVNTVNYVVFDKHPLLYPFLLICLFWLPYFISFFPGMLQWDAVSALLGYYGIIDWTNHHPVISTLLMGYIMDFGKYLGDDNLGCTIYVILQYFLLSISLAYNFIFFNQWRINYVIRWLVLVIFLLHPVFPTFAMTEVKDVFYYVAYLWLLFLFIRCFENYNHTLLFYIIIASMFVCAFRKEGVIVCIICAIVLLVFKEKVYETWKNVVNAILLGVFFANVISYGALLYYNVGRSSITEALSIPVQQTARYIRDCSEDITEAEWKILNKVFQNRANKLGSYYLPDTSDPVKAQIDYHLFREQMTAYFRVWWTQFLRHPGCYFSAAFNQMYGYFYIRKEAIYKIGDCRTENFVEGDRFYSEKFKIVDYPKTITFRNTMKKYIYGWADFPLLRLLYHPAVYTWLLIFGLSCIIHFKKYKHLFLYCMPVTVLCICCLSPVNAFIRYSYPIIISCFILIVYNFQLVSCRNL